MVLIHLLFRSDRAVKLAEENLRQVSGKSTSFGVLKYSFGDSIDTLLKWQQRVRRTDKKQADTTARKFDLVICSDVVYDEEVVPHFLKTMHALLDPPAVPQATTLLSNRTASPTATSRTETVAILGFKKRNRRRELLLIQALGREFEVDVALSSLTFEFTSECCFVMRCIL